MTQPLDLERMREVALKATPGDLDTIPKPNSEYGGHETGRYTCPCCGGDGEVEGETFTNFDGVAIGVQFFGIGNEFKNYEEFFRTANPAAVIAILDALSSERAAREEAEGERDAALREMSKYAREAGEAIGKLETSELAGIVEGWKDRALAAEAQVSALQAACYVASEPHLSGYRVILGFDTLNAAQDAHEALARARASRPPADEPAKGEG